MRNRCLRLTEATLVAICLLGPGVRALADDRETQTDPKDVAEDANQRSDDARQGLSSKKNDKDAATKFRSPHGLAMDGIQGSAPPAPGAFGTDARDPDDLRR